MGLLLLVTSDNHRSASQSTTDAQCLAIHVLDSCMTVFKGGFGTPVVLPCSSWLLV